VTGVKAGTTTITAKTSNGKTATKTITVVVPVTGLSIWGSDYVDVGGSISLTASITPTNATNKTVTWSSSNTSLATVNSAGKVTGVKAGTVTITAKTSNGITATKSVKIVKDETYIVTLADGTKKTVVGHHDSDYAQEVVKLVNAYRAENSLPVYASSSTLDSVAEIRAYEIVALFDHVRPDGSVIWGMAPGMSGENIAAGYVSPDAVMTGWKNSSGHNANILSSYHTKIAVGAFAERNESSSGSVSYRYYWVQIFGR